MTTGKKKIVYIVSHVHKSLAFEWIAKGLQNHYELSFILLNPTESALETFLLMQKIPVRRIRYRGKKDFMVAFIKTFFVLVIHRPQIIHAHLLDAQLIGLTSAWLAGVKKRIYSRHTSNYHQVYHPSGVRYDQWSNWLSTHIVSISQATDETLSELEGVDTDKIIKIPHGFDWNEFGPISDARILAVKKKWNMPDGHPVVGVIARHIEWKGIQYILPAFAEFIRKYPDACLILANASGPYHPTIIDMLRKMGTARVVLIPFEEDVAALYRVFDLYVHTPIDPLCEAFGQTYVEALASGIPSVFSLSGIAAEFIEDKRNAMVVDFKNTEQICQAMCILSEHEELRMKLIKNGKRDVISRFGIAGMLSSLIRLYEQ